MVIALNSIHVANNKVKTSKLSMLLVRLTAGTIGVIAMVSAAIRPAATPNTFLS